MNNEFIKWHNIKSNLNTRVSANFYEREIWSARLGKNIGFEQNGAGPEYLRPVVILKKFNKYIAITTPLTTKGGYNQNFYYTLQNNPESTVILSQIRLLDSKRFMYKLGHVSKKDFSIIKRKVLTLLQ